MHYQAPPYEEAKVVRCTMGLSTTSSWIFGFSLRLSRNTSALSSQRKTGRCSNVPEGFAHGFQTLEDNTEVFYQMSERFVPEAARGYRWNDPAFAIEWPPADRVIWNATVIIQTSPPAETVNMHDLQKTLDTKAIGAEIHALIAELYPICRSITGDGLRETFRRLGLCISWKSRKCHGNPVFD